MSKINVYCPKIPPMVDEEVANDLTATFGLTDTKSKTNPPKRIISIMWTSTYSINETSHTWLNHFGE